MTLVHLTLTSCLFLTTPLLANAQSGSQADQDPVGNTLRASELIHTDIGGFYKIQFQYTENKRKQDAFIRKRVDTYNSLSVQEAYSLVYESKTSPNGDLIRKLFQKSFTIGGLILEAPSKDQEFWRVRFKIDIPIAANADRVKTYVSLVAGTADQIEKELSGEDKL